MADSAVSDEHSQRLGCGRIDCDATVLEPVDLFCRTHNALVIGRTQPAWVRNLIGVGLCALICLGFFLSPAVDNVVPLYLVLCVVGALVVYLPLRMFPVAGPSVAGGWIIACALAPLLTDVASPQFRVTFTIVVVAVVGGWIVRLARAAGAANQSSSSRGGLPGAALSATLFGAAGGLLLLAWISRAPAVGRVLAVPARLGGSMIGLGLVLLAVGLVVAGGFAAVMLMVGWDERPFVVHLPALRRPPRLPRPRWASPATRTRGRASMVDSVGRFVDQFSRILVTIVAAIADLLIYLLYYWLLRILVAAADWLITWLGCAVMIMTRSFRLLVRAAWVAFRVMVIPAAGLLLAARVLLVLARADVGYALRGGLSDLLVVIVSAIGTYALLSVVWVALCALSFVRLWPALVDVTSAATAVSIILVLVGGWSMSLLGLLGVGPFTPGWLTLGATLCVVGVAMLRLMRRRPAPDIPIQAATSPRTAPTETRQ